MWLAQWANKDRSVHLHHTCWPHQTTVPDPETGQCDPIVAYAFTAQAVDVGGAINPQQVISQIQGELVQPVGYGVMEKFVEKGGRVLTSGLATHLVPVVQDIPDPRGP